MACLESDPARARDLFQQVLAAKPSDVTARYGIADAFLRLGQRSDALSEYLRLPPKLRNSSAVALRIGACCLATGELRSAIRLLRKCLPDPHVTSLLARCYAVVGKFRASLTLAESVLSSNPDFTEALKAACMAASGMGDVDATVEYSRRLMQLDPRPVNVSHYLYHLFFTSLSAAEIDGEYGRLSGVYSPVPKPTVTPATPPKRRPIRVGYVSGVFGVHFDCFEPIFRHHDRRRYEVHTFAGEDGREAAAESKLKRLCDQWHTTNGFDDHQLAGLVRETGIDILVDCDGHFQSGDRLGLYHYRPAPLQISFLYPHRTGVDALDYQITDAMLSPEDPLRVSEKLIRLPLFACHKRPPVRLPVSVLPALQAGRVTFGSFSPPLKINEDVAETWSRILQRVPGSRLVLHSKMGPLNGHASPDIRARLVGLFAKHGINRRRLALVGNRSLADHMAMYHGIDIALDPFPHNGMRTTFAALWMGVPVLTKAGDSMVSRMGVSLLTEAGLPDWIAQDKDAYVETACRWANDFAGLAKIRRTLRGQVRRSRLMDGERFTRSLEEAFERMLAQQ